MSRSDTGRMGEEAAVRFLQGHGLRILERNFRIRGGEIDVVACDGATVCFVEVKTRRNASYGDPREAVSFFKKDRLIKAGLFYIAQHDLADENIRFDVIFVICKSGQAPQMEWVKNAFEVN